MRSKKLLSLILSAAIVFTMNTYAFADEAVEVADAEIESIGASASSFTEEAYSFSGINVDSKYFGKMKEDGTKLSIANGKVTSSKDLDENDGYVVYFGPNGVATIIEIGGKIAKGDPILTTGENGSVSISKQKNETKVPSITLLLYAYEHETFSSIDALNDWKGYTGAFTVESPYKITTKIPAWDEIAGKPARNVTYKAVDTTVKFDAIADSFSGIDTFNGSNISKGTIINLGSNIYIPDSKYGSSKVDEDGNVTEVYTGGEKLGGDEKKGILMSDGVPSIISDIESNEITVTAGKDLTAVQLGLLRDEGLSYTPNYDRNDVELTSIKDGEYDVADYAADVPENGNVSINAISGYENKSKTIDYYGVGDGYDLKVSANETTYVIGTYHNSSKQSGFSDTIDQFLTIETVKIKGGQDAPEKNDVENLSVTAVSDNGTLGVKISGIKSKDLAPFEFRPVSGNLLSTDAFYNAESTSTKTDSGDNYSYTGSTDQSSLTITGLKDGYYTVYARYPASTSKFASAGYPIAKDVKVGSPKETTSDNTVSDNTVSDNTVSDNTVSDNTTSGNETPSNNQTTSENETPSDNAVPGAPENAPETGAIVDAGTAGEYTVSLNQSLITYNGKSLKKQLIKALIFTDKSGNRKDIKSVSIKGGKKAEGITLKTVKFTDKSKLKAADLSSVKVEVAKREVSSNSANANGAIVYAKLNSIKESKSGKYTIKVDLPVWNKDAADTKSSSVKKYATKKVAKGDISGVTKNDDGTYTIVFTGNFTGTFTGK